MSLMPFCIVAIKLYYIDVLEDMLFSMRVVFKIKKHVNNKIKTIKF